MAINETLRKDKELYSDDRFQNVSLDMTTADMIKAHPSGKELARLNRRLFEQAYPELVSPLKEQTFSLKSDIIVLPVGALAYGAFFLLLGARDPSTLALWLMGLATLARLLLVVSLLIAPTLRAAHPLRFIGAASTYAFGAWLCVFLALSV